MTRFLNAFWQDENGQDLIEYALLMALLAMCCVGLLSNVQTTVKTLWNTVGNALNSAVTSAG